MRIWHIGVLAHPNAVNGVNTTVWLVATQQAALGHEVVLLVDDPPTQAETEKARELGLKLLHAASFLFNYNPALIDRELAERPPDVVHMHSVYIPRQARLARRLVRLGIPYLVTPHGGMALEMAKRGWLKKAIYNTLIERRRFREAAAITIIIPAEETDLRTFAPREGPQIYHVGNPVDTRKLGNGRWSAPAGRPQMVFLGRFAVRAKGIDVIVEIARRTPEADFHLYGVEDRPSRRALRALKRHLPNNVFFHDPVYGPEKLRVLTNATLYLHMARCEVFGISIAESMHLYVPCAISDACRMSDYFNRHNLGLVLPLSDPDEGARKLSQALADPEVLSRFSAKAKAFADANFDPRATSLNYIRVYEHVLSQIQHNHREMSSQVAVPKGAN